MGLDKRSKMDSCGRAGDGEPKGRVLRTRIECMIVPNTPANTVYEVLSYCDEMDVTSYKIDSQLLRAKAAAEASSELYRSPEGKRSAMQALTAGTAKKARDLTHSPSTPLGRAP